MPIIKGSIQTAYNTLANWTAWNGILLPGQLSIVSNAVGDAVRAKIGDGVTAWNALPYYNPASSSQTLAQTLGFGNITGGRNIVVTNGDKIISDTGNFSMEFGMLGNILYMVDNTNTDLFIGQGQFIFNHNTLTTDTLQIDASGHVLRNSTLVNLDTPLFYLTGLTASTVPYLDANKVVRSSAVTPTQLSFLDATSSIQTQLNARELTANKGAANGYASLDATTKIPLSQIPASLIGAANYQGTWNASTNTPALVSSTGTKGFYYVVSVAGATNLDGITDWKIGDWAIYNGVAWEKVDNTDAVLSVNGLIGAVALTGTANRLTISAANVFDISASYVGQTSLTTLGTITTGTWQGTSISTTYTDAKIKGAIAATAGLIPYGNGTADTLTTASTFIWDNTNKRLGINVAVPTHAIEAVSVGTDYLQILGNGVAVANGYIRITNYTGTASVMAPIFFTKSNSATYPGSTFIGDHTTDTGTAPILRFQARFNGGSVVTRPVLTIENFTTVVWTVAANGTLTASEASNLAFGTTTGTKIGTATSQKIGFWNATPIVQPVGANQAAITDSTGGTAGFTLVDSSAGSAAVNNNFASLARLVDNMRTVLVNTGIMKGAA